MTVAAMLVPVAIVIVMVTTGPWSSTAAAAAPGKNVPEYAVAVAAAHHRTGAETGREMAGRPLRGRAAARIANAAVGQRKTVYMPRYVLPVGAPVDPCVTCRPRRTTPCSLRLNKARVSPQANRHCSCSTAKAEPQCD